MNTSWLRIGFEIKTPILGVTAEVSRTRSCKYNRSVTVRKNVRVPSLGEAAMNEAGPLALRPEV